MQLQVPLVVKLGASLGLCLVCPQTRAARLFNHCIDRQGGGVSRRELLLRQ